MEKIAEKKDGPAINIAWAVFMICFAMFLACKELKAGQTSYKKYINPKADSALLVKAVFDKAYELGYIYNFTIEKVLKGKTPLLDHEQGGQLNISLYDKKSGSIADVKKVYSTPKLAVINLVNLKTNIEDLIAGENSGNEPNMLPSCVIDNEMNIWKLKSFKLAPIPPVKKSDFISCAQYIYDNRLEYRPEKQRVITWLGYYYAAWEDAKQFQKLIGNLELKYRYGIALKIAKHLEKGNYKAQAETTRKWTLQNMSQIGAGNKTSEKAANVEIKIAGLRGLAEEYYYIGEHKKCAKLIDELIALITPYANMTLPIDMGDIVKTVELMGKTGRYLEAAEFATKFPRNSMDAVDKSNTLIAIAAINDESMVEWSFNLMKGAVYNHNKAAFYAAFGKLNLEAGKTDTAMGYFGKALESVLNRKFMMDGKEYEIWPRFELDQKMDVLWELALHYKNLNAAEKQSETLKKYLSCVESVELSYDRLDLWKKFASQLIERKKYREVLDSASSCVLMESYAYCYLALILIKDGQLNHKININGKEVLTLDYLEDQCDEEGLVIIAEQYISAGERKRAYVALEKALIKIKAAPSFMLMKDGCLVAASFIYAGVEDYDNANSVIALISDKEEKKLAKLKIKKRETDYIPLSMQTYKHSIQDNDLIVFQELTNDYYSDITVARELIEAKRYTETLQNINRTNNPETAAKLLVELGMAYNKDGLKPGKEEKRILKRITKKKF